MVDRLLADLEKSLDNDCYFAALSLALMLQTYVEGQNIQI